MTIAEAREKCKSWIGRIPKDMLIIGVLFFSSSASFGLGYLAGQDTRPASSISMEALPLAEQSPMESSTAQIVASKNGTKYYLSTCAGAARISEANKVSFASPAAATAAGYTPAANCKGI